MTGIPEPTPMYAHEFIALLDDHEIPNLQAQAREAIYEQYELLRRRLADTEKERAALRAELDTARKHVRAVQMSRDRAESGWHHAEALLSTAKEFIRGMKCAYVPEPGGGEDVIHSPKCGRCEVLAGLDVAPDSEAEKTAYQGFYESMAGLGDPFPDVAPQEETA